MEFFQRAIEWAGDQFNSNFVRTVGALVGIPGGLWGCYLFTRWLMGRGIDASVEQIRMQNEDLKREIQALIAYVKTKDHDAFSPWMVAKDPKFPPQPLMKPKRIAGKPEGEDEVERKGRFPALLDTMEPKKHKVAFLSFARSDRDLVLSHTGLLAENGIDISHGDPPLTPGELFAKQIHTSISRADVFVLFWSKAASESEWVRQEIKLAAERIKKGELQFFPIVLEEPMPPPPEALRQFHFGLHKPLGPRSAARARR